MRKFVFIFLAAVFVWPFLPRPQVSAQPSTPNEDTWITDGGISSMAVAPDGTLYVCCSSSRVGPNSGYGTPIDAASGAVGDTFPKVNELIWAAVSDGAGGWYIGGDFTKVGGETHNRLAHIELVGSDWVVDTAFDPDVNNTVLALALSGTTLYVGGLFTDIDGSTRNRLAAIDTTTGDLTSWNPNAGGFVFSLDVKAAGDTVYAGGSFTTVGGTARSRIAAISAADGSLTGWNPGANGTVHALELSPDESVIDIGGSFSTAGGSSRIGLAAIDTATGTATAWNPSTNGEVFALALTGDGSTLYVGGLFTTLGTGASARSNVGAVDTTTAAATSWNPGTDDDVEAIELSADETTVYISGQFFEVASTERIGVAAVGSDGTLSVWNPDPMDRVMALALNSTGTDLYIGGEFFILGGVDRTGLFALDPDTGEATDFDVSDTASASEMVVSPDGATLYIGGGFTTVAGVARNRLAAVTTVTSGVTAWDPDVNGLVRTLALTGDGTLIYAGGEFTTVNDGAAVRNRLAAFSTAGVGAVTDWDPDADDLVEAIALSTDEEILYTAGSFTTVGGAARNLAAALDADTGLATAWDPDPDLAIEQLLPAPDGQTVFAIGPFTEIGGSVIDTMAELDADTGVATSWDPDPDAGVAVLELDESGTMLFVSGSFTTIGGASRSRLAAIDILTGLAKSWDPSPDAAPDFLSFGSGLLYAGSNFTDFDGELRLGLAKFGPGTVDYAATSASGAESVGDVLVTINLTDVQEEDVIMDLDIGGTATNLTDYTLSTSEPTIAVGDTSVTFTISVEDDGDSEVAETIILTIDDAFGAFIGADDTFTFTISSSDRRGGGGGSGVSSPSTEPVVTVTEPDAEEELTGGQVKTIEWETSGSGIETVDLYYSVDGGEILANIVKGLDPDDSEYDWTVPNLDSDEALIRAIAYDSGKAQLDFDDSGLFKIIMSEALPEAARPTVTELPEEPTTREEAEDLLPDSVDVDDLVKGSLSTVYYIGLDAKRHPFPNEQVYKSWFVVYDETLGLWVADFDLVKTISDEDLADIPLGGPILSRPGTALVKIQSDARVFAVEPGYVLRWITSEEIARELYGEAWAARVMDFEPTYFARFEFGDDLDEAEYQDASLLKTSGSGQIWYVVDGKKRPFTSEEAFLANYYQWRSVITDDEYEWTTYSTGNSISDFDQELFSEQLVP